MKIYVDVITGTYGEAKDVEVFEIDEKIVETISEKVLVELALSRRMKKNSN